MAFNLYCNATPSVDDYTDAEEQINECRQYTVEELFCCAYAPPVTPAEPTEPVKEMVDELQDNNLELSDKPLDDGALASLSAMFGDDEED